MKLMNALLATCVAVAGAPAAAKADLVTDWNTIAVSTVAADPVTNRQSDQRENTRETSIIH